MILTFFTSSYYLSDLRDALFTKITHVFTVHVYVCISTQNHVRYAFAGRENKIE